MKTAPFSAVAALIATSFAGSTLVASEFSLGLEETIRLEQRRFDLDLDSLAASDEPLAAASRSEPSAEIVLPFPTTAEGHTQLPLFQKRIGTDLKDLFTGPARMKRRHWRRLGLGIAAVGLTSTFDLQVREATDLDNKELTSLAADLRPIGKELGVGLVGLSWLLAERFEKPRIRAASSDILESMLMTAVTTELLKNVAGRSRPNENDGDRSFGRPSKSFPSGEVGQAFALASVVARHSDKKWLDFAAWSYAGLIAWQRIQLDHHWASDTVAGALLGLSVGRWIYGRNNNPRLGERPRWRAAPTLGRRAIGFQVTGSLP